MIASIFSYHRPRELGEAIAIAAADPDGTAILAGGTWLIPDLERGARSARQIVDLAAAGLNAIEPLPGGGLRVGAMCTYRELLAAPAVAERAPLLRQMAAQITGGATIRNQATLGGSLIAARPQSDAPAAVVAAGGAALLAGPAGERRIPVSELFAGAMRSSLGAAEILCAIELERAAGGHGYEKLKLSAGSWPIATAAAAVDLDESGRFTSATLTLGGVASTPLSVPVGSVLFGELPDETALRAAAELAGRAVGDPWADALAPGAYRAAVAAPLARRALQGAVAEARGARR